MKTVQILKKGRPRKISIEGTPIPIPGDNEVLIKVAAAGVNFADILARQGLYPEAPKPPFIPGYEVAGTVESKEKSVKNFSTGDKVLAFTNFGGYAEYVSTPSIFVRHLPPDKSFEEAAGLPVNYITAYHCLYNTGSFSNKSRVLIHSAAGGVGIAAVQLCKIRNCEIFGLTSSREKIKSLKSLGVQHPVQYQGLDYIEEIEKLCSNEKLDIILNSSGVKNIVKELKLLKGHGRIVNLGVASLSGKGKIKALMEIIRTRRIHPLRLLSSSKGVYGVNIRKVLEFKPELGTEAFDKIVELYAHKDIKPVLAKSFKLENVEEAHNYLLNRKNIGKVILTI